MTITHHHSNHRMSQMVIHGDTIYLAGQVADDASADVIGQTEQCLAKVEALLTEAGSDKNHILSATIIVKDMTQFAEMNSAWDAWVADGNKPPRAAIEANLALDAFLVEVCIIAAVKA